MSYARNRGQFLGLQLGLLTKVAVITVARAVAVTLGMVMKKQVPVAGNVAVAEATTAAAAAAAAAALLSIHADVLSAASLAVNMTKKAISFIERLHFHVCCISSACWSTSLFAESNDYQRVWPPQSAISIQSHLCIFIAASSIRGSWDRSGHDGCVDCNVGLMDI